MYPYKRDSICDVICVEAIHCVGGWVGCKTRVVLLRKGAILHSADTPSLVIVELGYVHSVHNLRAVGLLARRRVSDGGSDRHR